uniref:Uncharacterized protein n=1 Tax=Rhizophora mucronata TaxID=61149 RepID=A0A2P2JFE0_RHIMU
MENQMACKYNLLMIGMRKYMLCG